MRRNSRSGPTTRSAALGLALLLSAAQARAVGEGTIRGRVVDAADEPIAAAAVLLAGTESATTSSSDGAFEIEAPPGVYTVEARALGYSPAVAESVAVAEGGTTKLELRLREVPMALDEIVVTSTFTLLREEPVASVGLSREQIDELPHFGDDLYRAVHALPGTSKGDISARFGVRGGLYDEILVRIDGVEVFEPFHLEDFQGVFGIVDPQVIGGVDLVPSAYAAEYGDRMSGVLDMRSRRPAGRETGLGISFSTAWARGAGSFAADRGRWLASARRGYLDMILRFTGQEEDDAELSPSYWDAFGKVAYDLSPSHTLAFEVLYADDSLDFEEHEIYEDTVVDTGYGNRTLWLAHQGLLSSRAFVDTVLHAGRLDRWRDGWGTDGPIDEVRILDDRVLDVYGLRQDWSHQLDERHYLKWGLEARRYEAGYTYHNSITNRFWIDDPRFLPGQHTTSFVGNFRGEQYAFYAADRMRLGRRLTAELGARYDEQTLTGESQSSPRVNLVYDLGSHGLARLGWGHYFQSQRPHEIAVQFGESELQPASRAEHWTLGYETVLADRITFRTDLYRRVVSDSQVRYETLFDPFEPFPEAAIDLVRIDSKEVNAEGIELFVGDRGRGRFDWWATYAFSSIEEVIETRTRPRFTDQPHAFTASASYRLGPKWAFTGLWTLHSGWPTTAVSARLRYVPGQYDQITYDVGPFYAERLSHYHRLDVRVSRTSSVGRGRLTFFLDVQNAYDRNNLRGVGIEDPDFRLAPAVTFPDETWLGIMPSLGVSWEL